MEKHFVEPRCLDAISSLNLKEGINNLETLVVCVSNTKADQWHLAKIGGVKLILEVENGQVVSGSLNGHPIAYVGAGLTGACICVGIFDGMIRIYLDIPLEGGNPGRQALVEMTHAYRRYYRDNLVEPIWEWLPKQSPNL